MIPTPAPTVPYLERESGIVVPANLIDLPEGAAAVDDSSQPEIARDADGRRRIVLSREMRTMLTRMVKQCNGLDLGFFFSCRAARFRFENVKDAATGKDAIVRIEERIPGACGEIMLREDDGGPDPGFGCKCTRIHFLKRAS